MSKKLSEEKVVRGVSDHVVKQGNRNNTLASGERRVGLSKGVTLNLGNYQSARLDLWMERVIPDNDKEMVKAYEEMSETIDELLEEEANGIMENNE